MLNRSLFTPQNADFREEVAAFLDTEIMPHYPDWQTARTIPRSAWLKAGKAGFLCRGMPQEFGGKATDFRESVVIIEELAKRRLSGFLLFLQSDIVAPYIFHLGTDEQKKSLLPRMATGQILGAVAMTEPQSGSDIHAIQTRISSTNSGTHLSGSKMHISNGSIADIVIVAARSAAQETAQHAAMTLVLTHPPHKNISREAIAKTGMRALDTGLITYDNYPIAAENYLGQENRGFLYLMSFLAIERLVLAIYAQAHAMAVLHDLVTVCAARPSGKGHVLDHQTIQFQIADLFGECAVNQCFLDQMCRNHIAGQHDLKNACIAKLRTTRTLTKAASLGVQFRGAQGISGDSGAKASQDLLDASVQSIWGGSSEIMLDVVGKGLANWA